MVANERRFSLTNRRRFSLVSLSLGAKNVWLSAKRVRL
jgi:hypothetical protein